MISFDDYKKLREAVQDDNQIKLLSGSRENGDRFEDSIEEGSSDNNEEAPIDFDNEKDIQFSQTGEGIEEDNAEEELTLDDLPF